MKKPIYTSTITGVNIYEVTPTDFVNNKTGNFYYANLIIWQQFKRGFNPLDSKGAFNKIIEICNSSKTEKEKISEVAHLSYTCLLNEGYAFNKNLFIRVCSQFYYTDNENISQEFSQGVINEISQNAEAFDFFFQRLMPLFQQSLNISEKDTQAYFHKANKVLEKMEVLLAQKLPSLKEM